MNGLELCALAPCLVLFGGALAALFIAPTAWRAAGLIGGGSSLLAALLALRPLASLAEAAGLLAVGPQARFFTVLWALAGGATCLLSVRYGRRHRLVAGEYTALVLFATLGMVLLSGASSLVTFFLGLEAVTLAFYVLLAFDRQSPLGAEAALKYLLPGMLASAVLAAGIALIYASAGSFHLPEALQGLTAEAPLRPLALTGWTLLLAAVAFKASLVPFHLWTPDVYQGAPAPVAGLLASASKGAVFAALLGAAAPLAAVVPLQPLLAGLAALSMIVGTLCALPQTNLKRMLAYSAVVHMGYLLMTLLAGSGEGRIAAMFYIVTYGLATLGAFGVIAALADAHGEPQHYRSLQGLARRRPLQAGLLAVMLLSLAGLPPLGGFMAKFAAFAAVLRAGHPWLVGLALLSSLVSCFYYLRPIARLFRPGATPDAPPPSARSENLLLGLCAGALVVLGLYPGPLLDLLQRLLP